jgi:predicted enzyme related to lactoylglutathione lyase
VISGISQIIVPVEDLDRAKQFWTERMGFEAARDETYGDERWVEVQPPGAAPRLVLSPRSPDEPRREVREMLPHSDVFFTCEDIEQTYKKLAERGVHFPTPPAQQHFGWWALFEDDAGTRYALTQS